MNLLVTQSNDFTIVSVDGRIDTTNANEFEKPMVELIEGGTHKIILDCSDLNYISSAGLRVFIIIQKKIIAVQGEFKLVNLQPAIQEIFDISGFSSIFKVFPDLDKATE